MPAPLIAVIDIGKTNAKLALVDTDLRVEVAVLTRPNTVLPGPPWPHFDTEGIWQFLLNGLTTFAADHPIAGVSITTHGACAALLDAGGGLAAPVLDYEHTGPDDLRAAYDAIRPPFAETGSPRLPMGLNLGAQLHWMLTVDPGLRDRMVQIVTWPQYWGHRLTGQAATDVTSLGCHTDLWKPWTGRFSDLPARLGIAGRIASPRRPSDVLGTLLPEIAARTGLAPDMPVAVGIHDSNASLLPHLMARGDAAFSVVSTGTWVVVMTMGGTQVVLNPARDTLVNVNAFGAPVPSARFMGGREYEVIRQGHDRPSTLPEAARVAASHLMLLPSVQPGCGPFPQAVARWTPEEPPLGSGERAAALSFYLALMTAECLLMTGAIGPVIVEGPFSADLHFCAMLAAATGLPVEPTASRTGTALGAALLLAGQAAPARVVPTAAVDPALVAYAQAWQALVRG